MANNMSNSESFVKIAVEAVKKIQQPLLLYGIVESVLLVFLLMFGKNVPGGLFPIVYAIILFPVFIAVVHFVLVYHNQQMDNQQADCSKAESAASAERIFVRSDSHEFSKCIENLSEQCQRFILIGTGLNILQHEPFAKKILDRAAEGECHLEVYLADPESPDVQTRLIEEEQGEIKPPVGKPGLSKRFETLFGLWKDRKFSEYIRINVFTHYPTFALIIIDNTYFLYPYGYATLGNFSPVLRFSMDNPQDSSMIEFLDSQYKMIKADAQDLRKVFDVREYDSIKVNDLYSLAVYIVPPANSAIYKFGSQILGYDIRQNKTTRSSWQHSVGNAFNFGLHLTVCDALYFFNESNAKMAKAAIEFIVHEFKPFSITDLSIMPQFPDKNGLAIVGHDSSGTLEALHYELVNSVYRRACASNYSLNMAKLTRDQDLERARLMIDRFKAPYILQMYKPHFTLMSNLSGEKQSDTNQAIVQLFNDQVQEKTLKIEKLAIMIRNPGDDHWKIEKEVELG